MSRILILSHQKTNRRLLSEYLSGRYDALVIDPTTPQAATLLHQTHFDLCIVDGPSLEGLWKDIQARKDAEAPIILPFLLATPKKEARLVSHHLWRTVDELITTPIEKVELMARVEILLRARFLSLEVKARREAAIRSSEERYYNIFNTLNVAVWEHEVSRVRIALAGLRQYGVQDTEVYIREHPEFVRECLLKMRMVEANPYAVKLCGARTRDELLTALPRMFLPETYDAFADALVAMSRNVPYFEAETALQTLTGRRIDVHIAVSFPARNAYFKHVLTCLTDITAYKEAERQIRRLNARLEERVQVRTAELEATNQELDRFVYAVSHDLRAPLRAIGGYSRLLREEHGQELTEEAARCVDHIREGAREMDGLIEAMLALSRISRAELEWGTVNLSRMAEDIIDNLRRLEPDRRLVVDIAPNLIVEGDPRLLRVLLQNLLENAWKFTRPQPEATIEFGALYQDNQPVFYVRDNGVGFDMRYADRLFVPFQRLPHEEEFEGSGVGLATVARIVQRHGGRIWAESKPGKGAAFFFTLSLTGRDQSE